jgi:hypothetical protein
MSKDNLLEAADASMNSLLGWGIGGIILAVFVAPTFWLMVKSAQKREDERSDRDDRESKERGDREAKLVEALSRSVEQQRVALEQWQRFEADERATHQTLTSGFASVAAAMDKVVDRLDASALRDQQILEALERGRKP